MRPTTDGLRPSPLCGEGWVRGPQAASAGQDRALTPTLSQGERESDEHEPSPSAERVG